MEVAEIYLQYDLITVTKEYQYKLVDARETSRRIQKIELKVILSVEWSQRVGKIQRGEGLFTRGLLAESSIALKRTRRKFTAVS